MSPSVVCYPQPGKAKSRLLLEAFAAGCGGRVVQTNVLGPEPAAFYGCLGIEALLHEARRRVQDWYYLDNAWFDCARGTHFRATKNALQRRHGERPAPDHDRLRRFGITVAPWRKTGRHVLVCPQSDYYMQQVIGWAPADWQRWTLRRIQSSTQRPIVVRHWQRDKAAQAATLQAELAEAWCFVTHSSAAANEALLAGVPVFLTAVDCAALPMSSGGHVGGWNIDAPVYPEGREDWAAGLCARQWTLEELRDGSAWRAIDGA